MSDRLGKIKVLVEHAALHPKRIYEIQTHPLLSKRRQRCTATRATGTDGALMFPTQFTG
ncbi:MAG: hypothetical protein WCG34_10905 [Leptolinea sp.]